ncbi:MAG TPA: hypothetical protein VJT71_01090 [Pyrinomonadaceae bacterium]|nr:hypothetical protein [Pyrinomonadaceae bacterium]
MAERQHERQARAHLLPIIVVSLLCVFSTASFFQFKKTAPVSAATAAIQTKKLYRIEVEDADEAGLIQQELKIKPEAVRGRYFYYFGDEVLNRRLIPYGYAPVPVEQDEILTRVVGIAPPKDDASVLRSGAKIVLRERESWFVRVTPRQLESLVRDGYKFAEVGDKPLVPRSVRILLQRGDDVNKQIGGRVEINEVRQDRAGLIVVGEAFDDAIDELRARSLKVEILPDYPGVVR